MLFQPPKLAVWLVDLFTPDTQTEPIRGDLLEEFSELACNVGVASARRWYWRQTVKTIAHLFADGFRATPWRLAVSIVAALLLDACGNWMVQKTVVAILSRYRVYAYINAYTFWVLYDIVVRLGISLTMGYVAAAVVKGREMVAAMTLSLLFGAMHFVSLEPYLKHLSKWFDYRFPRPIVSVILVSTFLSPAMIALGGILCRKVRFRMAR